MARELSQEAVLDFLWAAGGRAPNTALLRHFQRFLRDPALTEQQRRERREYFKSLVNSLATVHPAAAPGASKDIVLRRRSQLALSEVQDTLPSLHDDCGRQPRSLLFKSSPRNAASRGPSVPLGQREHAWLVAMSAGCWAQVRGLFLEEPELALQRDFISGFTVLHWLAKHGDGPGLQELAAAARRVGLALDVDARSGCGYTPLHLAAIHGHQLVIKVLVLQLGCQVQGLVVTQLDVEPGECIKVKGKIQSDAKGFAVNVGKDSNTLMLHFNPRFDCHGDVNTIVCNSKEDGTWGEEDRKADFPFQHGDKIEICISFDETEATVKLSEAEFKFPNRLGMEKIEYLAVEGDFKVKAI
ncbi:hypothetical protein HGM15179_008449, partial [Zosterops borbonicus]